jgi:hypothetical protein
VTRHVRLLAAGVCLAAALLSGCARDLKLGGNQTEVLEGVYAFHNTLLTYRHIPSVDPLLRDVVSNRLQCYEQNVNYLSRIRECRKGYLLDIVLVARQHVKSIPLLGNFSVCLEFCPIMYSICNGEMKDSGRDCIEHEIKCVDYCMDHYWRGAVPPMDRRAW